MTSITDLPIEVLLRIFKFYMQTESHRMFLNNVRKVSKEWKNLCFDSSLWTNYDGTPTFKQMMYLSVNGVLRNTKKLILSSSDGKEFIADEIKLFQNVQNVELISFSQVMRISNETLSIVAQNCTKLKEIKIGMECKIPITLKYKILVDFLSMRGCGIKKIDFSFCKISTFTKSIRCISDCCPNLEYLKLMNTVDSHTRNYFPIGYVQGHCSKLKSLYLDENIILDNTKHPAGFPDLEEFVYSDQEGFYFSDKLFESVLFNSPKLKFLSLTSCDISASVMLSLPACSVEYMYIPRSKACSDKSLSDLLKKWSHSLKQLDLSYGNHFVQHAVLKLIKTPVESPLEFLNLDYTPVNLDLVENIVKDCSHLKILNLVGCRNLLRGMKRTYSSKLEFQKLTEKISSYRSTNPSEDITIDDS